MLLDKVIFFSYATLFSLVPLIFLPINFELFEFNKMLLVYLLTVVITGTWLLKMLQQKKLIFNRTPLDIPLLLFLASQILSTIFSIDTHTSIFGYYSRQNGGLLSLISYLLLYWAFVSNIDKEKVFTLLKFALASGVIVSLWGILEHFGVSPSCIILRGEFNASCWVQDVQARVFATLGQPNWMAGYLAMLIFPALYFFLTSTSKSLTIRYTLYVIIYYSAFTFTYSRGATLGLIGGLVIFILFNLKKIKKIIFILLSFLTINFLFGSAITRFQISQFFPADTSKASIQKTIKPNTTQLETGGTESGQIRFIVWRGAWDIFKNYPIFGSGVETFGLSYYQFRPAKHNLVSEWDFLYNKAHNEYLNYLATTGIVGFGAYSIIIITFIIFILKKLRTNPLLILAILASYISYLIQNFFGFSVVVISLFFYLFPALIFVATDNTKILKINGGVFNLIYRRKVYTQVTKGIVTISIVYLLFSTFKFWYADTLFAKGIAYSEAGNPGQAYNYLTAANFWKPNEPYYQSELGYAAATAALALSTDDATLSASLKDKATSLTNKVLKKNPKNVSFYRTAIRTYFELSGIEASFTQKTLDTLDQTIKLAPTDPKLYYNKGLILQQMDKKEAAQEAFKKAVELKPNYQEAVNEIH